MNISDNPTQRRPLSVCIPVYDMGGVGHIFLKHSLDIITKQTFKDFDVVISDYSTTNLIKDLCETYKDSLDIKYFKNTDPIGGMAANLNNVIRNATGKLIKLICQDDFLYDEKSLEHTINNFDLEKDTWMVSACEHSKDGKTFFRPFYPRYNKDIVRGNNTISSPSVLTIKNENPLLFDTNLKWLVDCDYYKRAYDSFGLPKILNKITVVNRIGEHQITNTEATDLVRKKEHSYVRDKYNIGRKGNIQLKKVTLVAVSGINPTGAVEALELSMRGVDYFDVVLIAHYKPDNLNPKITFKQCKPTELVSQDPKNTNDYSRFMAYDLCHYIESDYALIVHKGAYVVRPHEWTPAFMDFDYIGAPWPKDLHFTNEGVNVRIGNGGFSLRSKRLLNVLNELGLPFTDNGTGYFHEDGIICVYYRKKLEENGIRFATVRLAARFSLEKDCDESDYSPFGFHDNKKALPRHIFIQQYLKRMWSRK